MTTYTLQILGKPDEKTGVSPIVAQRPHDGESLEEAVQAVLLDLPNDAYGYCLLDGNGEVVHRWVSSGPPP